MESLGRSVPASSEWAALLRLGSEMGSPGRCVLLPSSGYREGGGPGVQIKPKKNLVANLAIMWGEVNMF